MEAIERVLRAVESGGTVKSEVQLEQESTVAIESSVRSKSVLAIIGNRNFGGMERVGAEVGRGVSGLATAIESPTLRCLVIFHPEEGVRNLCSSVTSMEEPSERVTA